MPTTLSRPRCRASDTGQLRRRIAITFVIDDLGRAGTETQLLALVRMLDRSRFEPKLILLNGEGPESRALEPTDCDVVRLGVKKLVSRSAVRAAKRVLNLWRQSRPDVVQAYFLDASYFSVPVARWCHVPHVVRVRNNLGYWMTRKHTVLNRLLRPWVGTTLTNTAAGADEIARQDGVRPDRIAVIENGVDVSRFADIEPVKFGQTVRVGCVANLRPVKNIDGLMRAARLVLDRHPDVQFVVAGEGDERDNLLRLRHELKIGDRFQLLGPVADVPGFLRNVDVAVLPSHSEGMSNALLEYMAAGRAIVATDTGANARVVRDEREGLIVPTRDDAALADAISGHLCRPAAAAAEMGAAARRRAAAEYGREAMVRRFEEFYFQLVLRAK